MNDSTTNPFVKIIQHIDHIQRKSIITIEGKVSDAITLDKLGTKKKGLYWIWTRLNDDELINNFNCNSSTKSNHVPIPTLVAKRRDMPHTCNEKHGGYRVIYNGRGGSKTNNFGLRERILQEFNTTNQHTGTLSLANRYNKEWFSNNFAVSFFILDANEENCKDIISLLRAVPESMINNDETDLYQRFSNDLEIGWRLMYGVPILSRM